MRRREAVLAIMLFTFAVFSFCLVQVREYKSESEENQKVVDLLIEGAVHSQGVKKPDSEIVEMIDDTSMFPVLNEASSLFVDFDVLKSENEDIVG